MEKFQFSKEQIQYIKDNWGKESAHSMKKKFGCSWYAVVNMAKDLGFDLPESNQWTKEEMTAFLEVSYLTFVKR